MGVSTDGVEFYRTLVPTMTVYLSTFLPVFGFVVGLWLLDYIAGRMGFARIVGMGRSLIARLRGRRASGSGNGIQTAKTRSNSQGGE